MLAVLGLAVNSINAAGTCGPAEAEQVSGCGAAWQQVAKLPVPDFSCMLEGKQLSPCQMVRSHRLTEVKRQCWPPP